MSKRLVLIKLGGSLITDKHQPFTAQPERITFLAQQLAGACEQAPKADFIVGTGAGSFGHFTAHEYGLREGAHDQKQYYGMSVTHNAVARLGTMVAQALTDAQLPALTMSPAAWLTCANGTLDSVAIQPLKNLLEQGCIPMLHGDTITDSQRGTTILSTEKVLQACLSELRASYDECIVIYLLDIDGVLDQEGAVMPELAADQEVTVRKSLDHDVTGGIIGKVASARLAAQTADAVYIASGANAGVLSELLTGGITGTRVR